jgi:hypothetical protein
MSRDAVVPRSADCQTQRMVHMPNAVAPRAKEVYANLRNGEPDLGARQQVTTSAEG